MSIIGPIGLLIVSNVFMTIAWYGHLKNHKESPLWIVISISWGIAFFEYCFQVPANRWGSQSLTLPQLKIIQEVITMTVFAGFSVLFMDQPLKTDYIWASLCLVGAVYFVFRS
ncbi:MAG: DMT family protein [Bdellovibrionota bacterium]